jgi:hypothetical protein
MENLPEHTLEAFDCADVNFLESLLPQRGLDLLTLLDVRSDNADFLGGKHVSLCMISEDVYNIVDFEAIKPRRRALLALILALDMAKIFGHAFVAQVRPLEEPVGQSGIALCYELAGIEELVGDGGDAGVGTDSYQPTECDATPPAHS